jgi:hypothetical protein
MARHGAATPGVYHTARSSAPRTGHFGIICTLPRHAACQRSARAAMSSAAESGAAPDFGDIMLTFPFYHAPPPISDHAGGSSGKTTIAPAPLEGAGGVGGAASASRCAKTHRTRGAATEHFAPNGIQVERTPPTLPAPSRGGGKKIHYNPR